MKHLKLFFALMAMCLASFTEVAARVEGPTPAANGSTVYLPASDGVCSLYTVDGTVTFKAVASGSIPDYKDFGCAFQPANDGDLIMITVNAIGISGGTRLIMYDGDGDYTKIGTSGAGGSAPFNYFPAGWIKELTASDVGYTYTSTATNGMLSFGCTTRGTAGMTGWEITVTSLSPKDMEYVSTAAVAGLVSTHRGAKAQEIFGVDIVMDGGANPLVLNELNIDASVLSGSAQVTNVRLMRGSDVLSAPSTVGDALMATDVTLRGGHNKFIVLADILPDATGSIPSLSIASVKVDGASRTATPATATAVAISNVIQMGSTPATYTIDAAAAFYDDGGIAGNITQGFEGTLTFVPATDGQSIKVDFSKLDLFNTSSTGYNDVFKFYNGRTVDEANLITTILDEPELVKSTAADGSMTVYLKSTAGYPKSGWEAAVSQFLPGPMTMSAVNAQAVANGTVSAGDRDVQMLVVDVLTDNTSNPLSMTNIALKISDIKNVANIRAYYLGKKNSFSNTSVFAQTAVTSTNIVLAGNKELNEGHNYFAIVLDLNDEGVNGERIDVELQSVTVAGTTHAVSASASCSVDNICRLTKGSHVHTIREAWKFTHTASEFYPNKYEYEDAEYIVTFTPSIAGAVAEISFSSFDVYYVNTAYGTKAVFEIYNGSSTSSENLLWKLSDATESEIGPDRAIRSTAADGSLTIRFNPKTTSSYYAGKGWVATVRPFQNHNMTIEDVQVHQTSTADLATGLSDAPLIDFEVITEGTLTLKKLTGIAIDLKGAHNAVSKVNIYYNNVSDRTNAVLFGSKENPETSAITIDGSRELADGSNYFWVEVDLRTDVLAEAVIDAKLTALIDSEGQTPIANGDPDGARTVKYISLIQSGTNIVTVTDPLLFYDDGGKDGNITKGFKGTTIFVPGRTNSTVKLNTLSTFSIGSGKMYIYSGREVNTDNILGTITGYSTTNGPINLVSKAADGSLTVVFEANTTATTLNGWEIEVSLEEKVPYAIDNIEVTNTSNDVMRNSQNNVMHQIKLSIVGHKEPFAITQLKFYAQGAEQLANAKVYFTQRSNIFSNDSLIGTTSTLTNGENTISLSDRLIINDNGDYYLWLTYDISAEAVAGNTVSAQLSSINTTTVSANVAERTIKAGIKGFYIIGASDTAHYASFAQATSALQGGIEGAVTLLVEPGIYAEQVKIANVNGISEQNTLTIRSITGNVADAIVQLNVAPSVGYGEKVGGLISITNTPWVSIENLSVHTTATGFDAMVQFSDGCHHCSVRNCSLKSPYVGGSYSGTRLVHVQGIEGRNSNYALIENCYLEGGYNGIYFNGTGAVALPMQQGGRVINNQFVNNTKAAIYAYRENMLTVEGNSISNSNATNDLWAIDAQLTGNARICGNSITSSGSNKAVIGIYLRDMNVVSDKRPGRNLIANNEIIIGNTSGQLYGIDFSDAVENCDVVFNSIRLVQGSSASAGIAFLGKAASPMNGTTVINNLIHNEVGGHVYRVNNAAHAAQMQFHHNGLYTTNPDVFAYLGEAKTWDEWKSAATETGSVVAQPAYISSNLMILDPNSATTSMFVGVPLNEVPTDINGTLRSLTTPTIGAYEYTPDMVPTMIAEYPKVLAAIDGNATIAVRTDAAATVYCIVRKATEAAPTADELKASALNQDVAADREATIEAVGLEIGAEYIAYLLPVSLRGTDGTMSQTTAFTMAETPAPIAIPVADVYINNSTTEWTVAQGESVTLMAMVTVDERTAPYTLTWMDSKHNVLLTETYAQADDIDQIFTTTHTPTECTDYIFTVSDNAANTTTATVRAIVTGDAITATFENLYLDNESFWNAQTDDGSDNAASFVSGSYKFPAWNQYGGTYWYGYAYANQTSAAFSGLADQYHSATGGGYNGSENYVVHFVSAWDAPQKIEVLNNAEGDIISGFYVTNTAYAINSMTNGDGFAKKFEQGDWFKLTATGDNGNTAEFYLADLRSDNPADHYILDTWQWFDLSVLGQVRSISFAMSSSDVGAYGMNTPSYFCLDNFGGTRNICNPVTHEFSESACSSYDWNGTVYDASGDYVQTLTAANGCDSTVTLHLTINQPVAHEFTEVAEGKYVWNGTEYTQSGNYVQSFTAVNGCDSTVTLHLTITNGSQTGLISIERESLSTYPNPTTGELWLTVPELVEGTAAAEVLVYSINGQLLLRVPMRASAGSAPAAGRIRIDLSGYPAGIYIIRMGRAVAKVIKQ